MNDFLRGTFGRLLQIVFSLLSLILIFSGIMSCGVGVRSGDTVLGWILFVLGVVSGCAAFGVRYWLGHIGRIR